MPSEEFRETLADNFGLHIVPDLCERFGSSFEATVYRLATAYEGLAVAGLLRYRLRKEEERALRGGLQQNLFQAASCDPIRFSPKYRRQSLHLSMQCGKEHMIPWNKSFESESCVFLAQVSGEVQYGQEVLPNRAGILGNIEAVRAPYQRPDSDPEYGDVLFVWWR
jgi:hypothetical protein